MPRTEGIPPGEAQEIELEIKAYLAGSGSNTADIVRRLNEEYGTTDTPQSVTRQLKNGTIPYWKVRRIANVLQKQMILENKK